MSNVCRLILRSQWRDLAPRVRDLKIGQLRLRRQPFRTWLAARSLMRRTATQSPDRGEARS